MPFLSSAASSPSELFEGGYYSILAYAEVTADELKGYELWKESAQGAVFE